MLPDQPETVSPRAPEAFNMARHCLAAVDHVPDKVALTVLEAPGAVAERWTYAALDRAVRGIAGALVAAGVRPGDRVLLNLGNSSAFPLAFFGTVAMGGVAVPTSAGLTEGELAALVARVEPRLICSDREVGVGLRWTRADIRRAADHAPAPFARTAADDPAYLVFTSGTSARPKGVLHAHRAAWARRMMWQDWYGLTPDDRVFHAGAFNWTYTLGAGLTDPWAVGASALIYTGKPDRAVWAEIMAQHTPSIFAAVPGVYRQILTSGADLRSSTEGLRHGLSAGEALTPSLRARWRTGTGTDIHEALGMSEVSTFISGSPARPAPEGTMGAPQRGRRIALLADETADPVPPGTVGRLAVHRSDPGLMLGYWRDDAATEAAFAGDWFVTGDRAEALPGGALRYHGRSDDVMTAQGYRVAPLEVEGVLATHPAVPDCAVCEVQVAEDLRLIVGLVEGTGPLPADALATHCAERLAAYKCPKAFVAVPSLPRGANGKLLRRALPGLVSAKDLAR
ncbi:MAG: acyl-CoA synthetase [Pseudomonadota bacterium]